LLRRLGLGRVEIVVGDGIDGYQRRAPYDGIIVTAGVRDVAPEWGRQLSNGGRLVVPLTGEDGVGEVVAFVKRDRDLLPVATSPCAFLPIRDSATNT
jgi:protein-L-isoaspartate(D-aspartate) O-methyltransferase